MTTNKPEKPDDTKIVKVYMKLFEVWAIDKRAKAAGLSRSQWLAQKVRRYIHLKEPK